MTPVLLPAHIENYNVLLSRANWKIKLARKEILHHNKSTIITYNTDSLWFDEMVAAIVYIFFAAICSQCF